MQGVSVAVGSKRATDIGCASSRSERSARSVTSGFLGTRATSSCRILYELRETAQRVQMSDSRRHLEL